MNLRIMVALVVGIAALSSLGCGTHVNRRPAPSTLGGRLSDPDGDGYLQRTAGEPLLGRTELAPPSAVRGELARFAQISDAHLSDEESPVRLEALDRLGAPFSSAFRPQEALGPQVLTAATRALNRERLDAVVETGDLVDGAQANEYTSALGVLDGGRVDPDSGERGYQGVQSAGSADPFFYRPAVDPPHHSGILSAAERPFRSPGLRAPWYPVAGNHDLLVAGLLAPSPQLDALAVGARRIVEPPRGLRLGESSTDLSAAALDGRPQAALLADRLLREGRLGTTQPVPADARRHLLSAPAALHRLRTSSRHGAAGDRLDYTFDIGRGVRAIVLDAVSRPGGSGGTLSARQLGWLDRALRAAGGRWILVFSHQPLDSFPTGRRALTLLDDHPRVLAAIAGHTHRNRIEPHRTRRGGYWRITSASLVDFPQQVRIYAAQQTADGAVLDTWVQDTAPDPLADTARELGHLDAQGGRPGDFSGRRIDRNVRLYVHG
ncbi:MAG: metallophosphoesterase [Actinomycetota bacterium]|nr:metallophosphoesterase [Actinomycetota bacterium]